MFKKRLTIHDGEIEINVKENSTSQNQETNAPPKAPARRRQFKKESEVENGQKPEENGPSTKESNEKKPEGNENPVAPPRRKKTESTNPFLDDQEEEDKKENQTQTKDHQENEKKENEKEEEQPQAQNENSSQKAPVRRRRQFKKAEGEANNETNDE